MEHHAWIWAGFAALMLGLCLFTAWSRINKWYRWGYILCGIALAIGFYPAQVNLLSRPRNVSEEWFNRHAKEALVTGVYVDEGVALYLYLILPGVHEPRSYKMPWNESTRGLAESLQDALESPEGQEGGVVIPSPFEEPSLEREKPLTAHPRPQQKRPDKLEPRPPMEFRGASAECRVMEWMPLELCAQKASYIILEPRWWSWWI